MENELLDLKRIGDWIKRTWAASLGIFIALVLGILIGIVYKQGDIIDDCKYTGNFRVHSQAFTCIRKM